MKAKQTLPQATKTHRRGAVALAVTMVSLTFTQTRGSGMMTPLSVRDVKVGGEIGREHAIGVHAKHSDDDGRTWIPWAKGAALPGSQSADWSDGTYGYPETVVTPYKEHVACFWRHKRKCGVKWSVYDGSDWSAPADVSPITLDDMDGAYRATMSAITKGDREIFFTALCSRELHPVCLE